MSYSICARQERDRFAVACEGAPRQEAKVRIAGGLAPASRHKAAYGREAIIAFPLVPKGNKVDR
jgi:hypothetical protein